MKLSNFDRLVFVILLQQKQPYSNESNADRSSSTSGPFFSTLHSDSSASTLLGCLSLRGRPKGTSNETKRTSKQSHQIVMNVAATRLRHVYEQNNFRFPRGVPDQVIEQVKEELGMSNAKINKDTVLTRVRRNKPLCYGRGSPSPTHKVDEAMVQICCQLADMRQCIGSKVAIQLVNSLIHEKDIGEEIMNYKKKLGMKPRNKDGYILGYRWWLTFLERNANRIHTAKGRKFSLTRDTWCTYSNFASMYDHVYDDMVDAGVAEKLEKPMWLDSDGKEVLEEKATGRKSTHRLLHPENCLCVDETGSNTSMKGDGNGFNRKFVARAGDAPQLRASDCDNHTTTLCFTTLSGEAVLCTQIFKGEFLWYL